VKRNPGAARELHCRSRISLPLNPGYAGFYFSVLIARWGIISSIAAAAIPLPERWLFGMVAQSSRYRCVSVQSRRVK
jgi:hypothetical protein